MSKKNGDIIHMEVNAGLVDLDGHKYILAIERDITERKKIEYDLKRTENKYRTIFETTGATTATASEDTTVQLVNKEFERLSGYSKQEIEGQKSWTEFISRHDLEHLYIDIKNTDR
ncbi:PAS domain S-box protein [Methanohalobium evestigatum]|uniref:PAS domain S-box protein n=1 Tax=Methanohalobium evestigatum TaxID=2322 RepID=UPI0006782E9D|nr:PAS domain S-box protein [Methanohalobium evestigatum]